MGGNGSLTIGAHHQRYDGLRSDGSRIRRRVLSTTKRIVCLANSRKFSGRCVAGREIVDGDAGRWVRPVSSRPSREVSEEERQYEDGSDPRLLDIIDVPLIDPCPDDYHTEDWRLDPRWYWTRVGRMTPADLLSFVDSSHALWINDASTFHGLNDKISIKKAETLQTSLALIRVPALQLRVFAPFATFGNPERRVQGCFEYAGVKYRLRITDPEYERRFLEEPDGDHDLAGAFLTVSISEPFEGYVYKLVAAVIEEHPA